jgi:hypothetical protein
MVLKTWVFSTHFPQWQNHSIHCDRSTEIYFEGDSTKELQNEISIKKIFSPIF